MKSEEAARGDEGEDVGVDQEDSQLGQGLHISHSHHRLT